MSQVVCSICWENITKFEQLLATNCGHLFHAICIHSWMRHSETCPQCRAECCSPKQFYLTFEDAASEDLRCTASAPTPEADEQAGEQQQTLEINSNIGTQFSQTQNEELQTELRALRESRRADADRNRKVLERMELRIANLEIQLLEAMAKEKTLSEEFHYKLQDLNTEFHYKFQDLKKAKEELLESLSVARNVEDQLRNNVDEARQVEQKLRVNLMEHASRLMDAESEKAELQSKLAASEKNARWLKQVVDELQDSKGIYGNQFMASGSNKKSPSKGARGDDNNDDDCYLQKELAEYEDKKQKLEDKLRKLRKEVADFEEKEEKLREVKKDLKKSNKDNCIVI